MYRRRPARRALSTWCAGRITGFPIPTDCESVGNRRCETVRAISSGRGPFGEWMGYYADDNSGAAYFHVKTILHRHDSDPPWVVGSAAMHNGPVLSGKTGWPAQCIAVAR